MHSPSFDAVNGANGEPIFMYTTNDDGLHFNPDDASRIVSCVNSCAGMADPAAEIAELKRQRDELLGALEFARDYVGFLDAGGPVLLGLICVIDDAIAKAKGSTS